MARDRSIVVRLRAEVSDFKREMDAAAAAARKVGKDSEESGKGAQTVLGQLARSATQNRAAWTTAGSALVTFGAAVTGIGVAALKTGIEYNTLQQTTRAALTTLLGSAQAANEQMDRLDAFARTSPFSKQVFIQAQQQLIGFGYAAKDVVPILDAIQNAVAATGGSNADIAELADVVAKVGAEGKITAIHLQQFGKRGIDAAELIGSQMGKTGAEIREAITAGALDADAAIAALTVGMQSKFGGAADNVKNTFEGALDRVKAAWRDMAAELARPLVDPDGGGMLIGFMNTLADVMRTVEALPTPIKNTVSALGGLGGVAALTGGSMMLLLPRLIDTRNAVQTLRQDMPRLASGLGKVGKAAAVLGTLAVLNSVGASVDRTTNSTEEWINKLEGAKSSAEPLPDLFAEIKPPDNFSEFLAEVGDTGFWASVDGAVGKFANNMANIIGLDARSEWTKQRDALVELGDAIGQLASRDLEAAQDGFAALAAQTDGSDEALRNLLSVMPTYEDALYGAANAAGVQLDETQLLEYATGDLELSTLKAADATIELADDAKTARDALRKQREALAELTDLLLESANATLGAREADVKYRQALIDSNDKIKENNEVLKKSKEGTEKHTDALISNEEELNNLAGAMLSKIEKEREAGASTVQLREMTEEMRGEFVKSAKQTGRNEAAAEGLADALGLIPGKYNAQVGLTGLNAAMTAIDRFNSKLNFVNGKRVTAAVEAKVYGQAVMADGGFTHGGMVESFASGGVRGSLPKQALIQSPRRNLVQWAEPETGGEAFIPLSPAKRQRSLQIWAETGRRLGAFQSFAGGGLNQSSSAQVSAAFSLSDSDVARIAAAVRDGSASGVASGFSGGRSDVARFARMGG